MVLYQIKSDYGYGDSSISGTFIKKENAIKEFSKLFPEINKEHMFNDEMLHYIDDLHTND